MSILWQLRSILRKNDPAPDPQVAQSKTSTPSAPVERRNRKRVNTHKGRRVLIVDDSPTIIAALKKILRSAGCFTVEALDAETGLELLRREKPDLVFLDIVLPGMNGFAALRLMRRDPQTQAIPVIMISGNEQATEQFYAKRIGADDFMKKPFSRHEVFARIENLVEAKKLPQLKAGDSTLKTAAKPGPASVSTALSLPPSAPVEVLTPPPVMPAPTASAQAKVTTSKRTLTPLEARMQLTAMGLQYYNQEQFLSAIERSDALAIELFMLGGAVNTDA
jgi:CheY-like chemotaxis protein